MDRFAQFFLDIKFSPKQTNILDMRQFGKIFYSNSFVVTAYSWRYFRTPTKHFIIDRRSIVKVIARIIEFACLAVCRWV